MAAIAGRQINGAIPDSPPGVLIQYNRSNKIATAFKISNKSRRFKVTKFRLCNFFIKKHYQNDIKN